METTAHHSPTLRNVVIVATLLCFFCPCYWPVQAEEILVNASAPANSNSSLEYYLCEAGNQLQHGTVLQLSPGTHTLGSGPLCLLQNIANLTIQGWGTSESTVYTIRCTSDIAGRGLAFYNMTGLRIAGIVITNCGMELPSELPGQVNDTFFFFGPQQKAVLLFTHCVDMLIESVAIKHCYGFGLININPLGNTVMNNVSVTDTNNRAHQLCSESIPSSDFSCSGSGSLFIYTDTDITQSLTAEQPNNYLASLSLIRCSLVNNTNEIPFIYLQNYLSLVTSTFGTKSFLLTGGGGLSMFIQQLDYFVNVLITESRIEKNTADFGGGMFISNFNSIRNAKILINSTTIANNEAMGEYFGRGGGMVIIVLLFYDFLNSFPKYPDDSFELIEIRGSIIESNCAQYGGAIYVHISPQNVSNLLISVKDTEFTKNVADQGSALNALQIRSTLMSKGVHFLLEDVRASDNYHNRGILAGPPEDTAVFLFVRIYNITIIGSAAKGCYFSNNAIGVLQTSGGHIFLGGNISFVKNQGFNGGALSIFEDSLLFIHEDSSLLFEKNSATRLGGAIFADTLGSEVDTVCVMQLLGSRPIPLRQDELKTLNLTITFSENTAGTAGNSIFANPIYNCFFLPETIIKHTSIDFGNETLLYQEIFSFTSTVNNSLAEVVSYSYKVCICQNVSFVRNACSRRGELTIGNIIPGQKFQLYLNPIDSMYIPVSSLVYSEVKSFIENSSSSHLGANQDIQQVQGLNKCSPVEFNIFASEHSVLNLTLLTAAGGVEAVVMVNMTSCPPGFILAERNGRKQCSCSSFIENDLHTTCNQTTYTIMKPEQAWIGTVSRSGKVEVVYVSTCPINYCLRKQREVDLRIPDYLCRPKRTGILCGGCKEGFSTVFGSADCKKCSDLWLATILVFSVLGLLLVFVLFLLDLTVTQGTVNGLVFFANLVSVNAHIFFFDSSRRFLFVFISLLNLELGFPMCFYDGMDELAKTGLQYIFPLYILLIGGGIMFFSQFSKWMQRIIAKHAGLHVLCTMLYISYSKLLRNMLDTITTSTLHGENDRTFIWFFDGNITTNNSISIFLFMLATLGFFVFVIPYVSIFTFSRIIQRFVTSPRFNAILDANLAPYKDKLRFWFGVRLILILILYITFANLGSNSPNLALVLQAGFITVFAIIQAFIRPFKNLALELLDMFFIVNIILLMLGVLYANLENNSELIVVIVHSSLAFIVTCGIVGWHIATTLWKIPAVKKKMLQLKDNSRGWCEAHLKTNKSNLNKTQLEQSNETSLKEKNDGHNSIIIHEASISRSDLALHDMIPAPDNANNLFTQLREPVLAYVQPERNTA